MELVDNNKTNGNRKVFVVKRKAQVDSKQIDEITPETKDKHILSLDLLYEKMREYEAMLHDVKTEYEAKLNRVAREYEKRLSVIEKKVEWVE